MKNAKYYNSHNVALSLSNLYYNTECSVTAIKDVVEDAHTAVELRDGLNKLNLFEKFRIDRVTDTYARLKSVDGFGNTHYFKAEFDEKPKHHLNEYYDGMADNYQIPTEEMTSELMKEAIEFIKRHPYEEGGYLLMYCPKEIGYEISFWCITSWTE